MERHKLDSESEEYLHLRDDWERVVEENATLVDILRSLADPALCFCGREGEDTGHSPACIRARAALAKQDQRRS